MVELYALKVQSAEVLCGKRKRGDVFTREGAWFWVVHSDWGPTTVTEDWRVNSVLPDRLWTFGTVEAAVKFERSFRKRPHPWYVKPNGRYMAVPIEPVTKVCGYREYKRRIGVRGP